MGNGPTDMIYVGIERKRLSDLVDSIRTERLSGHQLGGLLDYFNVVWLIVEGIFRCGPNGDLQIPRQRGQRTVWESYYCGRTPILYEEVDNFVTTMQMAGMNYKRTAGPDETVKVVVDLYRWFSKEWKEHKGHLGIYAPIPEKNTFSPLLSRPKANLITSMAAQLPGLYQRAWKVGTYFSTPLEMACVVCAVGHDKSHEGPCVKAWKEIDGIGSKGAKQIVEVLHGRQRQS